ncbi:SNF2 family N-terminal domain-containing protein [Echria macrotheca]|uniref:SNF2 family N-terminal domain-containing protein n=1 Tax=Echria macrotheca TaxID=438768 RepID=A0AAJ0B3N6_9PEZI|nr:SNF2 family N-terminal domain-containing protein [Echria macrotheca]
MDYPSAKKRRIDDDGFGSVCFEPANDHIPWQKTSDAREDRHLLGSDSQWESVESENHNSIVCYGMIRGLHGTCTKPPDEWGLGACDFSVSARSANEFVAPNLDGPVVVGKFATEFVDMIHELIDEGNLRLQFKCMTTQPTKHQTAKRSRGSNLVIPCSLSLILYGPLELSETVGDFFQEMDLYLQDPEGCDWNVKYSNPHRLSSLALEDCPMTFTLHLGASGPDLATLQHICSNKDVSDIFVAQQDLDEAPQPNAIQSHLKRHQKQALTFLLNREAGWNFDPASADFWDQGQTSETSTFFVNNVSQSHQVEEPDEFCGGIVADPMGLGKTLTMIALAATDALKTNLAPSLIIVPPPLLDTWEDQLVQHVKGGHMKWRRHHQKDKILSHTGLSDYDVILTTYHTVMADWGGGHGLEDKVLFSTTWRRIILDEAHVIRNFHSQISKSVCTLQAAAKWAVTGTPVQNRVGDLAALLKFIQAYPYNDLGRFDTDIGRLWKVGDVKEAAQRLKVLSNGLILRRPKTVIELPPRTDLKCPVDLTAEERTLYERLKNSTISQIEEALNHGSKRPTAGSYINVIQRINALRMMCNLGLHYDSRYEIAGVSLNDAANWASQAQVVFDLQRQMDPIVCSTCNATCDLATAMINCESQGRPLFAQCLSFFCADCVQGYNRRKRTMTCGHSPPHPVAPVSLEFTDLESGPGVLPMSKPLSSKVTALIAQLRRVEPHVKSVVFSSWRMSLDLVEAGLEREGIGYLRFDGKLPQKQRKPVIDEFKRNPKIRVFLLTLSCGAVGLTLTEACRAYLLEPHWNPTLEEQALARVHRLGQQKEVTTVRFYVKDTFEERILDVQESKKKLESVLLERRDDHRSSNSLDHLEDLRRLI